MAFDFFSPDNLADDMLQLRLRTTESASESIWKAPTYRFEIHHIQLNQRIGHINLRVADHALITQYVGHIGYGIDEAFRGNHFAERACRIIIPLAWLHCIDPIWITCGPDNPASRRTLERLGAQFVEIVNVPDNYPMPEGTLRQKCRFRLSHPR
jgi:predicted acetyltransferase